MRSTLIALFVLLTFAPAAGATSIAYIDGGEVWLSSLDGAQKVRLATHVVNGAGETEKWLAVAASDSGRIVAARNVPGRISRFSWFKVWEPDGTSTVEGPLNAPNGWASYVYPLGFDVTPDGKHMIYGYSNSGFCCPQSFGQGTYVRPVTNSSLDPIVISGAEDPTLFGNRVIAHSGAVVNVQDAATTYGTNFAPWIDVSASGLELHRTDVAANGALAALELEQWDTGSQTIGKIAWWRRRASIRRRRSPWTASSPRRGRPRGVPVGRRDADRVEGRRGLKVAGTPTSGADPCELTSPPAVISATASQGAIGGANIAPFLPAGRRGPDRGTAPAAPGLVATFPKKLKTAALAGAKGVPDQGQGHPRRQGQALRDRAGEDPEATGQARHHRDRIGDRKARRDGDGEAAADIRGAQEARPLEGRADDAASEPGRRQQHQAHHASMNAAVLL